MGNLAAGIGIGLVVGALGVLGAGYRFYRAWKAKAPARRRLRVRARQKRRRQIEQLRRISEKRGYVEGFHDCYEAIMGSLEASSAPTDPAEQAMEKHRQRYEES